MTFGARAAAAAVTALTPGPFGLFWRRDVAREFQACGEAVDLSGIHTTCGVFASACWDAAGRKHKIPRGKLLKDGGHIGGSLTGTHGWVEAGMECFVHNDGTARPEVGDILCHGATLDTTHHVDIVTEARADGTVVTAHGGDSPTYPELVAAGIAGEPDKIKAANGTVARLGAGPKTLVGVCGWLSARITAAREALDDVTDLSTRDTDPGGHAIENEGKA